MDRRDVLMVNQSFDQLGDSLLRNRMLEQSQGNTDAALTERKREFDVTAGQADRRTAVDEQNANTMEGYRQQVLKDAKVQQGIAGIRQQVESISQMHKAGQINTAEANRKVRTLEKMLRQSPELMIRESGLADVNFSDIPPKPDSAPADVDTDRAATELESLAAKETDPAAKSILLERAKKLRSGIGRQDPGAYIEETEVLERGDDGKPVRSQKRRIPADQVNKPAAATGKQLTLQQAQEFLKKAGGDKTKARELARQAGFTF